MKKVVLVFCIILVVSIMLGFSSSCVDFFGLDYMSFEEISQLYNKHHVLFNDVANKLMNFPDGIRVEKKKIINKKDRRDDWIYYEKDEFLVISTNGQILDDEALENIDYIPIKKLFRKTKIDLIMKENQTIQFVQASNISFCVGIEFNPRNELQNPYIYEWKNIKDSWYYFEQE